MRAGTRRASCVIALCFAIGCGDDTPFLPLDKLCGELAVDVCDARDGCCEPESRDACLQREQRACGPQQQSLEAEQRSYDAEAAAHLRGSARTTLDACGSAPTLASFYEGGLALGATCERDGQCQSGRCAIETHACVDAIVRPLCASP